MPDADARSDDDWNRRQRDESPLERLDRNWGDLVQELRVVQTGVQFLTGFLLTLPFQQRFARLGDGQLALYLVTVGLAVIATAFLQAPVSIHRALFHRHRRATTVAFAHRLSVVGIGAFGAAVVCVSSLIFDVVIGWPAGLGAGAVAALLVATLWLAIPWSIRARDGA